MAHATPWGSIEDAPLPEALKTALKDHDDLNGDLYAQNIRRIKHVGIALDVDGLGTILCEFRGNKEEFLRANVPANELENIIAEAKQAREDEKFVHKLLERIAEAAQKHTPHPVA